MMSDTWIPITLAICLMLIIIASLYFANKYKSEVQQTIRAALDKNSQLTPEHIAQINKVKSGQIADLRRSVFLLALGIAISLAGLLLNISHYALPIAIFPTMLGLGYLLVWWLNKDA